MTDPNQAGFKTRPYLLSSSRATGLVGEARDGVACRKQEGDHLGNLK